MPCQMFAFEKPSALLRRPSIRSLHCSADVNNPKVNAYMEVIWKFYCTKKIKLVGSGEQTYFCDLLKVPPSSIVWPLTC